MKFKDYIIRNAVIDQLWIQFKIGRSTAERVLDPLVHENYLPYDINVNEDIQPFFDNFLTKFIYPFYPSKKLMRFRQYDDKGLQILGIDLEVIGSWEWSSKCEIPFYYDRKNMLFWDQYRESRADAIVYQLSDYADPLSYHKIKYDLSWTL